MQPPNFAHTKTIFKEERYPWPASDKTRGTRAGTDDLTAGIAVRTDLSKGKGSVTANWVRTNEQNQKMIKIALFNT